jgi:hypothetical protein
MGHAEGREPGQAQHEPPAVRPLRPHLAEPDSRHVQRQNPASDETSEPPDRSQARQSGGRNRAPIVEMVQTAHEEGERLVVAHHDRRVGEQRRASRLELPDEEHLDDSLFGDARGKDRSPTGEVRRVPACADAGAVAGVAIRVEGGVSPANEADSAWKRNSEAALSGNHDEQRLDDDQI